MGDVRLTYETKRNVGGLSLESVVSCCMAGDFL